jgi:hypothetical protein
VSDVEWGSLMDALLRVEQLGPADCGMLSFAGSSGGIFVERGRICWVAARGLQRRLSDLLRAHGSVDSAQLERIYQRCRSEGTLLGQTLVAEGLLQPVELEYALRRHSAECLVALCRVSQATIWASHPGRGYAPRFTFRPLDLLFDSVALLYPDLRLEAFEELSAYGGPGRNAVAFVLDTENGALLPLAATNASSVESVSALARSLLPIPRASHELGMTPAFALSTTASGDTLLVWWRQQVLYAMTCEDRAGLIAATSQHLACA